MKSRAMGPYTFIRYTGNKATTALILNAKGQERHVSASNLLPVHPPSSRMQRFQPGHIAAPGATVGDDDSDYSFDDQDLV